MFLFAFFFLVILLNNFLNINVVHRYFPDTPVSGKTKSLMKIAGILAAICWLFLFLVSVYGLSKELSAPKENYDKAGIIIAIVLLFMWLLGLYTFIMQLGIFKSLNRASNQKINSLIDSIGTQ
jgi:NADH:ubiquinone oxidoreductase subunit 6 (subunit J)